MTDARKPTRSWQEIAAEAAREKDPEKLIALTRELELALDERDRALRSRLTKLQEDVPANPPPEKPSGSAPEAA